MWGRGTGGWRRVARVALVASLSTAACVRDDWVMLPLRLTDAATDRAETCAQGECLAPTQAAASNDHTCARMNDGRVMCWGNNEDGQLGDGTTTPRPRPTLVAGLTGVVTVSAGYHHSCAYRTGPGTTDGGVSCWGANNAGQLGTGDAMARGTPVPVPDLTRVVELVTGESHNCVRRADRSVSCWGYNDNGQVGDGSNMIRRSPYPVPDVREVSALVLGTNVTCALSAGAGGALCWGSNNQGQFGNGMSGRSHYRPTPSPALTGVAAAALGNSHGCFIRQDALFCVGANEEGQLGNGTIAPSTTPVPVSVLGAANPPRQVAAGLGFTCALLANGDVHCWGANALGQLGDGTNTDRPAPAPTPVLGGAAWIIAGRSHACAGRLEGTMHCWGNNAFGQLGDGTTTPRNRPVRVMF